MPECSVYHARTHTDKAIKYAQKWTGAKTSHWALRPHFHVGDHFNQQTDSSLIINTHSNAQKQSSDILKKCFYIQALFAHRGYTMHRCTHLYIVYQAVELNVPRGGCFPSTFHLTFSRSLCIYLSHYSAPVASLTLQRNCFAVYLSCSDASPNSLPVFHLFIPLHSFFCPCKEWLST